MEKRTTTDKKNIIFNKTLLRTLKFWVKVKLKKNFYNKCEAISA